MNVFKETIKMRFSPRIVTSVAAIALTCFVSAAAYYYKSRKTEINDVMIFCKLQYNVFNYYDKLLSFIESADQSIDVCMPSIHNPAIQGRLVEIIKRKNILTRILIDKNGYNESTAMFLEELAEVGAQIKFKGKSGAESMQHKFCLVDNTNLITGTLDWGNDLSCDQWNYVFITNKPQLVQPVAKAFFNMWHHELNNRLEMTDSDTETKTCDSDNPAQETSESSNPENPAQTADIPEENSYACNKNVTTHDDRTENGSVGVKSSGHSSVTRKSSYSGHATLSVPAPLAYEYPSNNVEVFENNYVTAKEYNSTQISNGEYITGYSIDTNVISGKYYLNPRVMPGRPDFNKLLHEDFISSQKSTAF